MKEIIEIKRNVVLNSLIIILSSILLVVFWGCGNIVKKDADRYIEAVVEFADNAMVLGKDVYGTKHTPLFVDGLNVNSHEPVKWKRNGVESILSNLTSQQNFFRVLDGLSNLTKDQKYRKAAVDAFEYAFENLRAQNGLLHWGGHVAYDAKNDTIVREGYVHELKCFFPYYPMMWEIDREFTKRFLETCWAAHILDWSILDMNRHGKYDVMFDDQWKNEYIGSEVFFVGKGLTFCNIGSDLIYAGAMLNRFTGEEEPLVWAKHMAHRYNETRNPKTGLVGYQYSQIKNDRAQRQFGPELGPKVLEGTLIEPRRSITRYALMGICQLRLGEMLGKKGDEFKEWALEDLTAYGKNVYNPENNTVIAMITDGRKLSPADVKREGYYGSPENFAPEKIDITFLWAYALAYRIGENEFHWQMARDIAKGYELGDIGETPGGETAINMNTECSEPRGLLGVLEIYRKTGKKEFLELAKKIGDNILSDRFYKGFFVESKKHIYARFSAMEPLALLHLAGVIKGKSELIPQIWPSNAFFHNRYDGAGRTTDISFIYSQQSQ